MVVRGRRRVALLVRRQQFDHVAPEAVLAQQGRTGRAQTVRREVVDTEIHAPEEVIQRDVGHGNGAPAYQ